MQVCLDLPRSSFKELSDLVMGLYWMFKVDGRLLSWPMDGVVIALVTKLEKITFPVYRSPELIRFGIFKHDWLVADRAIYFWLRGLHC